MRSDVSPGWRQIRTLLENRLDRWLPRLRRGLSWMLRGLAAYWVWCYFRWPAEPVGLSISRLEQIYRLDYGSEIAFLSSGFLFGMFALSILLYFAGWLWNLAEAQLRQLLPLTWFPLARQLIGLLLMSLSLNQIPRLKQLEQRWETEARIAIQAVMYKSQTRAASFGEFVVRVQARDQVILSGFQR